MNDFIDVLKSDLNYEGAEVAIQMSRIAFSRLPKKKFDGRYLYQRISPSRAKIVNFRNFSKQYDLEVAKRNNLPSNWRENRWIVEQVRPI